FLRIELEVPLPNVGLAAQAADHPLAKVSREMKQEVADGIRGGVRPPPDFLVAELSDGESDLGQILVAQIGARLVEEEASDFAHRDSPWGAVYSEFEPLSVARRRGAARRRHGHRARYLMS